jgi:hypothetical protein
MRYWTFQNNEVCGPHDAEDLAGLPGYSTETLVCPEGRKGTRMGDWQRAGMVPDLAISLAKAAQLAPTGKSSSPASAVYAGLPQEPTLKDLAALGSLQEKVALLESAIAQFKEGMQSQETEMLSLHREIDLRKGIEADLQGKVQELEQRLTAVAQLRETIDSAVAAEKSVETEVKSVEIEVKGMEDAVHGVESTVQEVKTSMVGVSSTVKDLESSLEKQRLSVSGLMTDIERLKSQATAAPTLPLAQAPVAPPAPFPLDAQPAGLSALPPAPLFLGQPQPAEPAPVLPCEEAPAKLAPPSLLPSLAPGSPTPSPAGPETKPVIADIAAGPDKPKSGKKGLALALVFFGLFAGGVLAFQAGLIPGLKRQPRRPNLAATTPLPPPPPQAPVEAPAQTPSPEAQLDELKHQAIDLVKNWPSSDKAILLGQRLEASAPGGDPAVSWMAEKLGDNLFQVNFYGGKSATGKQTVYMFQADLGGKAVSPYNDDAAAKLILFGEPPAPKVSKLRVKPRRRAAAKKPAPAPESGAAQQTNAPADAAAAAPDKAGAPGPQAPSKQAGNGNKPAKSADDAQLLDKLLE